MSAKDGIKEIARLAGVSIGTVDRVLHKRGRVSDETRQKIEEIIRQIGYKPNLIAKSLVLNKKFRISLLVPEPLQDEYWQQAYKGAENAIGRYIQLGMSIEPYFYSLDDKKTFEDSAKEILKSLPNGIIMAPNFLGEGKKLFEQCQNSAIPVIMFDTIIPGTEPLGFFGTDSYQSGQVVAQLLHISTQGKGKFVILHFDEEKGNSPHMLEKEKGFMDYVNLECPQREMLTMVLNNKKHFYRAQLQKLFENNTIEGVFVSTSKTYRVGQYLKDEGLKGIKLAGYDLVSKNIELMKAGFIDFLINQNPGRQAELSINSFCNYFLYNEQVKSRNFFPIEIITSANLNSYIKALN